MARKVKRKAVRRSVPARRSAPRRSSSAKRVVISPMTLLAIGAIVVIVLLYLFSTMPQEDVASDPQAAYQSSESVDLE